VAGSPGLQEFIDNFARIQHTRPQTVVYPAYSSALGAAIVAVLSGEKTTVEALAQANDVANAALSAANTPVRRWRREAGCVEVVRDGAKNQRRDRVLPCAAFGANAAWFRLCLVACM